MSIAVRLACVSWCDVELEFDYAFFTTMPRRGEHIAVKMPDGTYSNLKVSIIQYMPQRLAEDAEPPIIYLEE
jgi:hypothetical protein